MGLLSAFALLLALLERLHSLIATLALSFLVLLSLLGSWRWFRVGDCNIWEGAKVLSLSGECLGISCVSSPLVGSLLQSDSVLFSCQLNQVMFLFEESAELLEPILVSCQQCECKPVRYLPYLLWW